MSDDINSAWRKRRHMDNIVRNWDTPQAPTEEQIRQAINAKLEELASECERFPFSDTGASFAIWIREHKV
ncbi:MAG: hypothetical protein RL442_5 [Pseudomonadota bacterium]|jgi:hypothetical protein